ncbi:hypothetical protein [Deinococcus pimensis]|uniref:hypothetical protein n=1 Tax=Deinococcus pimensis TaxID=309888 RepID=UPI0004BAB7EF|nr:hypothetical protein [Deinococcus pimensis]
MNARTSLRTASAAPGSHVNLSPKGLDTFRVLNDRTVAYLDLTGSGNETSAHLQAGGRLTVMFCAFEGSPLILRLYGHATVHRRGSREYAELLRYFGDLPGARQIVLVQVERMQTSCGFGVPRYRFEGQRDTLIRWANAKGDEGFEAYRSRHNARSIDGLPASWARVETVEG